MATLASRIYGVAAVYGVGCLLPNLFQERKCDKELAPVPVEAPVWFYGFNSVALTFQFVFALMATDPIKYRDLMPLAMLEKFGFVACCIKLHREGRLQPMMRLGASIDALLGVAFGLAYYVTRPGSKKLL